MRIPWALCIHVSFVVREAGEEAIAANPQRMEPLLSALDLFPPDLASKPESEARFGRCKSFELPEGSRSGWAGPTEVDERQLFLEGNALSEVGLRTTRGGLELESRALITEHQAAADHTGCESVR